MTTPRPDQRSRVALTLRSRAIGALAGGTIASFSPTELLTLANELDPERAVTVAAAIKDARGTRRPEVARP